MPAVVEREQQQDLTEALFGGMPEIPAGTAQRPRRRLARLYGAGLLAIILAGAAWLAFRKAPAAVYATTEVRRTNIAKTVSATGRLQALMTVQVGTQVSGTISELYVDYNSQVTKGQVIARLDPSQLQAQLTQANANLAGAQASAQTAGSNVASADAAVQSAQANLERLDSVLAAAQLSYDRTVELVEAGVAPRRDIDPAKSTVSQAAAQKQQGLAQLNQARAQAQSARSQQLQANAQVSQATASVELASVNLEKTVILAPISGTVVSRSVDVGQTVAASLQAPVLFLIANDLTRMQVLADIDEADVGLLKPQSPVRFTVDAYPTETFKGAVSQVRLAPMTVQNVVTYTAVIDVANPDLKLKPGMTANVTVIAEEQRNVLAVPNAALRFRPETGKVYRVNKEALEPVSVRLGLSNGVSTQVVSGDLKEGDRIAIPAQNTAIPPAAPRGGMLGRRIR